MNLADLSECQICFGPILDRVRYAKVGNESWTNTSCQHSGKFCRGCLQRYVQSKLTDGCWNIKCPSIGCSYLLLEADMQRIMACGTISDVTDVFGQPLAESVAPLNAQDCTSLLEKYRSLRNADHGDYLRAVLRMRSLASQSAAVLAATDDVVGEAAEASEDGACNAAPAKDMENADRIDDTERRSEASTSVVSNSSQVESEADSSPVDEGFGTWAVGSCQACPRCLVIIRKETGCDHVQCRCGSGFCYGCGAPYDAPGGCSSCLCRTHVRKGGVASDSFCFWLLHSGSLDAVQQASA